MFEYRRLLSQSEINEFLNSNENWSHKNDGIERELTFDTYMNSIDFINKIAVKAEELNHHPDMTVGWCKIQLRFSTHDLDGLSTYDLKMAEEANSLIG